MSLHHIKTLVRVPPDDNSSSILATLLDALESVAGVCDLFPPLKAAISSIRLIAAPIVEMSINEDSIRILARQVQRLVDLENPSYSPRIKSSDPVQSKMTRLQQDVNEITKDIQGLKRRSRFTLAMRSKDVSNLIHDLTLRLSWALNNFMASTIVEIEVSVNELRDITNEGFRQMNVQLQEIKSIGNQVLDSTTMKGDNLVPRHARHARFDHNNTRIPCQGETRLETLAVIYHWIDPFHPLLSKYPHDLIEKTTHARVFWLSGLAGTGKSTLAQTVAEQCDRDTCLGASFFCARDSNDCSDLQLVFPTIAYQLGLIHSGFREEVSKVIKADPDIQDSSISRQLLKLVVEPLKTTLLKGEFPKLIVIIDALDECRDESATSIILSALAHYISDLAPLSFFITSRPVHNIISGFKNRDLEHQTQTIILHDIPLTFTERDIRLYLNQRLFNIANTYEIDNRSWPGEDATERLVSLSNGLFIFAATAMKFVEDQNASNPREQLNILFNSSYSPSANSPFSYLDVLYLQVLKAAFPGSESRGKIRLKIILGSIVLIHDLLQPDALEELLQLPEDTVRLTLRQLQSILILPPSNLEAIRLIHPSFHDFLIDDTRCTDYDFRVNTRAQHTVLAIRCLESLHGLKKDICGIGDFSKLNSEIPNVRTRVSQAISTCMSYACRHWAYHFVRGEVDDTAIKLLASFCYTHLLHWLEALSLLEELHSALESLRVVRLALQNLPLPATVNELPHLIVDCERVVRQAYTGLRMSCFQAYLGVVPFCPLESPFRKQYTDQSNAILSLLSGVQSSWGPCINIMEGHTGTVRSAVPSPDGKYIASGSEDTTIRFWDTTTGAHLHTLVGHRSSVTSVSFSPCGKELLSSSLDATVKCWDIVTGACKCTWDQHQIPIHTVAYSPDGFSIASGSDDGLITIRGSNFSENRPLTIFRGHRSTVCAIAFFHSSANVKLASGSYDGTCLIWDCATGDVLQRIGPGEIRVSAVAISPDDKLLACGYGDASIVLFNPANGTRVHELKGHKSWIWSIDFSPDSQVLASGSWDHTIGLWSTASGTRTKTLVGHPDQVLTVRFLPDSSSICSGGCDHSVRIWEHVKKTHGWGGSHKAQSRSHSFWRCKGKNKPGKAEDMPMLEAWDESSGQYKFSLYSNHHTTVVRALTFSPDGQTLATGSWDGTVRLWATNSGEFIASMSGHSDLVSFLDFSSGGDYLASSGHGDSTVRLWDIANRSAIRTLEGHSRGVWMVKFSGRDQNIYSCSDDGTIRQWGGIESSTQRNARILYQGMGPIYAISVSLDNTLVALGSLDALSYQATVGIPRMRVLTVDSGAVLWEHSCNATVASLAFSDDNTRLASGLVSGGIMLWDVSHMITAEVESRSLAINQLRPLAIFDAGSPIEHIAFSRDGKAIYSDASYHTIIERDHLPHSALTNDSTSGSAPVYFLRNNWIWCAVPRERRICWLPMTYRHVRTRVMIYRGNMAVFGHYIALGTENGLVVLLKISE